MSSDSSPDVGARKRSTGISPRKNCSLHWAGHTPHWIQVLGTLNRPEVLALGRPGTIVDADGEVLLVELNDGAVLRLRHHDSAGLRAILAVAGTSVVVHDTRSLIDIGGRRCISVAQDNGTPLEPCLSDSGLSGIRPASADPSASTQPAALAVAEPRPNTSQERP